MSVGSDLAEQYRRVFETWAEAIESCPDDEWRRGVLMHLTPARAAVHAIETVEFYAADGPDGFRWGYRFGVDWEQAEAAALPSRQETAAYNTEVAQWLADRLAGLSDADLLAPTAFPWTGSTRLATLVYCLRHTQHHAAQIGGEMQRRGLGAVPWH
ncbi:MAG: DinB family protein [Anaerolineae bacterium]